MLLFIIERFHQNKERIFINIGNLGEKKKYKYNVKTKKNI